ncbi:RDD family protein [Nocardiopsis listeri]|uniref:RDD family protein n=1 Tax=Nocardiopsis listeri TaxID=53440 RepID=UPI0008378154|nr:RDD family protein [Nocardiopsis listeri]
MGRAFGGGQAAIDVAVVGLPLLALIGSALYLRGQHRRYGRLVGRPGRLTLAALLSGLGLAAYAVWPLPTSIDGLCPVVPRPTSALDVGPALLALGVFLPVGILARARFRRGLLVTFALGMALASAVTAVRATGVFGLYPCSYADDATALTGIAVAGVLLGWLLARWVPVLWPWGPHRSWPGAVPDRGLPDLTRRVLGVLLDLGSWWYGSALIVALSHAYGVVEPGAENEVRTATLLGLAAVFWLFSPLLRRDRSTPGCSAVRLALTEPTAARSAARHRVLARTLLLHAPVVVLIALGLGWWSLIVVALHACTALVRPDGTGLADLVCGTRVRTRATLDGGLPGRLVRYSAPDTEHPRPPERWPTPV